MGQGRLRKLDFGKKYNQFLQEKSIFRSFGEKITFANACAVQTKHGTKKLLNKKYAREYGLLAKRIGVEKKEGCFKVPLRYLGFKTLRLLSLGYSVDLRRGAWCSG